MRSYPLVCITFLWMSLTAFAQTEDQFVESRPSVLGISVDYGFLLKHSENLQALDQAYPWGIRLDWSKHLITQKSWDFCNCFPRAGITLEYWNWDKPDILGHGIITMGYLEPYFRTQKRMNFFARMGLGGAYLTKPFDEVSNPLNLSYSTNLSFAIMVGFGINYRWTDQLNIRLAANYNHISNGGISTPNKGLNFPSVNIGLNKSLVPIDFPNPARVNREAPKERARWTVTHFSGWSNASVGDKDKFYVFGFEGKYARWIGGRSALNFGTEVIFDLSRRELIELEGQDNSYLQAAALVGHEFWLGKVTFSQQLGVYYFNDYRVTDDVYQRYGLSYYFSRHIFAGFNLKAHRHVADFFDFRIGYRF